MKLIYVIPLAVSGLAAWFLVTFALAGGAVGQVAILGLTAVVISAVFAWSLDQVLTGLAWFFKKFIL